MNDDAEHEAFLRSLPDDIRAAHDHCDNNRQELNDSKKAGCFYCLSLFDPAEIWEWMRSGDSDEFAMCPHCGIDSVIGDASGYAITREFLLRMNQYWFDGDGVVIEQNRLNP